MSRNILHPFFMVCLIMGGCIGQLLSENLNGQESFEMLMWIAAMAFMFFYMLWFASQQMKRTNDPYAYLREAQKRFGQKG